MATHAATSSSSSIDSMVAWARGAGCGVPKAALKCGRLGPAGRSAQAFAATPISCLQGCDAQGGSAHDGVGIQG